MTAQEKIEVLKRHYKQLSHLFSDLESAIVINCAFNDMSGWIDTNELDDNSFVTVFDDDEEGKLYRVGTERILRTEEEVNWSDVADAIAYRYCSCDWDASYEEALEKYDPIACAVKIYDAYALDIEEELEDIF